MHRYIDVDTPYDFYNAYGTGLALADFDNDGTSDIAVGHQLGVTLFWGGSVISPAIHLESTIVPAPKAMSLFAMDVNLDGNMDLVSNCVFGPSCYPGQPTIIWYLDGALDGEDLCPLDAFDACQEPDAGVGFSDAGIVDLGEEMPEQRRTGCQASGGSPSGTGVVLLLCLLLGLGSRKSPSPSTR